GRAGEVGCASGGASPDQGEGCGEAVAAAEARHGGGADRSRLDVARRVVVSCATLAAAGGGVSPQEWGEAARGGDLSRRCAPARPALRASPGGSGPLGGP